MHIHNWRRLTISLPDGIDKVDPIKTGEVAGALRSLVALFPDKAVHLITTTVGLLRCAWDEHMGRWNVQVVASGENISVKFV